MGEERPPASVDRLEITAILNRNAAEALGLEIRRLARRYGVDIRRIRIERVPDQRVGRDTTRPSG